MKFPLLVCNIINRRFFNFSVFEITCMKRRIAESVLGMLAAIRFSLLSSRLLSRNVKVKIYKTIILSVVLCVCETCLTH
jgi:hypothetical protein